MLAQPSWFQNSSHTGVDFIRYESKLTRNALRSPLYCSQGYKIIRNKTSICRESYQDRKNYVEYLCKKIIGKIVVMLGIIRHYEYCCSGLVDITCPFSLLVRLYSIQVVVFAKAVKTHTRTLFKNRSICLQQFTGDGSL